MGNLYNQFFSKFQKVNNEDLNNTNNPKEKNEKEKELVKHDEEKEHEKYSNRKKEKKYEEDKIQKLKLKPANVKEKQLNKNDIITLPKNNFVRINKIFFLKDRRLTLCTYSGVIAIFNSENYQLETQIILNDTIY